MKYSIRFRTERRYAGFLLKVSEERMRARYRRDYNDALRVITTSNGGHVGMIESIPKTP